MAQDNELLREVASEEYKYGFVTEIESELAPKGLNEDTVRYISAKKNEPEWMLEWRLRAFRHWLTMTEPTWALLKYPKIDFQDAHYYSAPKKKPSPLLSCTFNGIKVWPIALHRGNPSG